MVLDGTYPKLDFGVLLSENKTNVTIPGTYNLMISLAPSRSKIADRAVMVTTIIIHEGTYRYVRGI